MTDPAERSTPVTPDPAGEPRLLALEADPSNDLLTSWDRHRELLALLLVVGAIGQILSALLAAYGYAKPSPGSGEGITWGLFLPALGNGGAITTALLVAAALVVAVGSGRRALGRLGWLTVQAVSVVGVVSATLALLSIEEYERNRAGASDPGSPAFGGGGGPAYGWIEAGLVAQMLPSAALAGGAAYVAWRYLQAAGTEVDAVPEVATAT